MSHHGQNKQCFYDFSPQGEAGGRVFSGGGHLERAFICPSGKVKKQKGNNNTGAALALVRLRN